VYNRFNAGLMSAYAQNSDLKWRSDSGTACAAF